MRQFGAGAGYPTTFDIASRIRSMQSVAAGDRLQRAGQVAEIGKAIGQVPRLNRDFPPVVHPVTFVQPDTGRSARRSWDYGLGRRLHDRRAA
ncbi:hypothetical protein GG804_09675 [Sphingomonas histidinilytica]|uniref:Uncharacterized protein n=1 Tax=Rhizorhabdus histidinilytica TaxID=439228 RepID=A0A1T5FT83_9SPHN|nr:hypothetical protein [Rhizorhabdus histidinilytica]MBO9377037.1 hypothetical protein [Rhizorhabdus histidinilytica]SKB99361.1 hypothetical protein SAMN06295920_110200 [Rhizorhabdus histidinilytica]